MSAPILTGKLRMRDDTAGTLRSMTSRISRSFRRIATIAAGVLTRDLVRGFVSATREGAMLAGQVQTLQAAFTRFTQAAGVEDMTLNKLRLAVRGTVGDVGLLTAANNAMALGLPVNRLNDLFSAAMSVGHAMGRTTLQAVNDVATGIGRQSRLILDNLGIIVNAEFAQKQYAATLGKVASELTEQERKQAFVGAAMKKLMEKAVLLEGTTSDLQVSYEQWGAAVENLKRKLGEIFLPILVDVTNALLGIISTTQLVIESIRQGDWEGAWQSIRDAIANTVANISMNVEAVNWDEIFSGAKDIAERIGEWWDSVDWASIWTNITTWWNAVEWIDIFTGLTTLLSDIWNLVVFPGLQAIGEITSGFLNWFGEVDWGNVFDGMREGMAKFWPKFQDAVGDITTLMLDWFASIDWGKVFRGMAEFATELNRFFYDQQEALGKAFAHGLGEGIISFLEKASGLRWWRPDVGGAGGYEGYVSKPTLFLAGEAGGEHVSIRNAGQVGGGGGYSPTFVFHIGSLTGDRAGANQLGRLTAVAHLDELRRRGKTP